MLNILSVAAWTDIPTAYAASKAAMWSATNALPTREALVLDACARITAEQAVPDTGTLTGDLHAHLTNIAELLQSANWAGVLPCIIDAAERDTDFATVHGDIQRKGSPRSTFVQRSQR